MITYLIGAIACGLIAMLFDNKFELVKLATLSWFGIPILLFIVWEGLK